MATNPGNWGNASLLSHTFEALPLPPPPEVRKKDPLRKPQTTLSRTSSISSRTWSKTSSIPSNPGALRATGDVLSDAFDGDSYSIDTPSSVDTSSSLPSWYPTFSPGPRKRRPRPFHRSWDRINGNLDEFGADSEDMGVGSGLSYQNSGMRGDKFGNAPMNFQVRVSPLATPLRSDPGGMIQRRASIAAVLNQGAVAVGEKADSLDNLLGNVLPYTEVSTERPHLVRLTPVGKTYVQYSVRESPFVSKLCETTLSRAEIAELKRQAALLAQLQARCAKMEQEASDREAELAAVTAAKDQAVLNNFKGPFLDRLKAAKLGKDGGGCDGDGGGGSKNGGGGGGGGGSKNGCGKQYSTNDLQAMGADQLRALVESLQRDLSNAGDGKGGDDGDELLLRALRDAEKKVAQLEDAAERKELLEKNGGPAKSVDDLIKRIGEAVLRGAGADGLGLERILSRIGGLPDGLMGAVDGDLADYLMRSQGSLMDVDMELDETGDKRVKLTYEGRKHFLREGAKKEKSASFRRHC
mmetsp:Transcript_50203/g.113951  ORF Transcript_50203/g.113951 Transcript_50203/m.113951 type:complete len:524 (-) Transcript_50203:259-1830(-)